MSRNRKREKRSESLKLTGFFIIFFPLDFNRAFRSVPFLLYIPAIRRVPFLACDKITARTAFISE